MELKNIFKKYGFYESIFDYYFLTDPSNLSDKEKIDNFLVKLKSGVLSGFPSIGIKSRKSLDPKNLRDFIPMSREKPTELKLIKTMQLCT